MSLKLSSPFYYLIVVSVAALAAGWLGGSDVLVFVLAAVGLIPLAKLIGDATEELAIYTGPKFGGLLNATLGNAAELILAFFSIQAGLLDLVRASITGSIIGNLLLVLGAAMLFGGLRHGTQRFDKRTAGLNATLVVLAVMALAIPSLFDIGVRENPANELAFNEGVALILIGLYALTVIYSFRGGKDSHHDAVAGDSGAIAREAVEVHTARWSRQFAIAMLVLATVLTALVSETLVGVIEPVTQQLGVSEFFLGIILIPLVGNVAEHLVAVQVALKNKMELSLAVALGSSLQVALLVAPLLVFISLLLGQRLLLAFNVYELVALFSASFVAAFIAQDGESNWLEGAMLLAVYLILALAFFFLPGTTGMGPIGAP